MALNIFILLTLLMVALSTSQDFDYRPPSAAADVSSFFVPSSAAASSFAPSSAAAAAAAAAGNKCCSFEGTCWESGSKLTDTCFKLKCTDGTWQYTPGELDPNCGKCNLKGDPHITTFDKSRILPKDGETITSKYILKRGGHYVISQPGFNNPVSYGVSGKLENCAWLPPFNGSCIYEASYHQPGIDTKLILPPPNIAADCTYGDPARTKECDIKVFVNGENFTIGDSVEYFNGLNGAILVFKHNDIGEDNLTLNCITIVGSTGLSVSLCEVKDNLPYFYVWALPSLKSNPSKLHGLCNTFTGVDEADFVLSDKTVVPSWECLTWTPDDGEGWEICEEFTESWKFLSRA